MELRQDWHIHTTRSPCALAENTIPNILARLHEHGIVAGGLTDHVDAPRQQDRFAKVAREHRDTIRANNGACALLVGVEATMIDPATCAVGPQLARILDYVVVACNHYHLDIVERPADTTPAAYADHYLDMILGACALGYADVIAHPFLNMKCGAPFADATLACYDEAKLLQVLDAAARAGVAIELNPYSVRRAIEWFRDLVQEGRIKGCRFALGSDSHDLVRLGYLPYGDDLSPRETCHAIGLLEDDLAWLGGTEARNVKAKPISEQKTA
ncbi:MAG: hypothetical protein KJ052_01360 [Candidatus Hydrogenedentes bacterium]|nr:hypothetical protein [Candidatus Hydrogenedentota bacterium]